LSLIDSKENNLYPRRKGILLVEIPLAVNVLIMLLQAIPRGNHLFGVIDARHRFALFPWANHQTFEGKICSSSQ
jgi:hypothetical protein